MVGERNESAFHRLDTYRPGQLTFSDDALAVVGRRIDS